MRRPAIALALAAGLWAGCARTTIPTAADAQQFMDRANATLLKLGVLENQAGWVEETDITDDTEALSAHESQVDSDEVGRLAKASTRFDRLDLPPDLRRQLNLLKLTLVMATPSDPKQAEELSAIAARLDGDYGKGKWCPQPAGPGSVNDPKTPDTCMDVGQVTDVMATSRDPKRLREVWEGWHTIAPPMRQDYARFVELSNAGARELGFADTGAMWRSKYDMPADDFTQEIDRLWEQVRPLYVELHAYVRMKLHQKYGDLVPAAGPIPADLLGNIWAQDWSNVYDLVKPEAADGGAHGAPAAAGRGYSLTAILKARQMTPVQMMKIGERFYTSLGFAPLPATFWSRSMFTRPRDRDVVCHPSAWDIDEVEDVRIKMCVEPTAEDFSTLHHELGHNFYQRAYDQLPVIYRDSANDGFHEAIGDTIALSVTPEYLVRIGLLDARDGAPDASQDIGVLMSRALEKIAFLPFGLLIDQWRWDVFSGKVTPADYNKAWWDLRLKYQGVAPPTPRGEAFFDPGAKYHVPSNTPYARYFLAAILQFQFHRALSTIAGCTQPLDRCSIYESKAAGARLNAMLSMGLSKPWPDALEALTGSRRMDATALLDYFAPLKKYLDEQTKGQTLGW